MKNSFYPLLLIVPLSIACESSDDIEITNYVLSSYTRYVYSSTGIDTFTSYYTYNQRKLVKVEVYGYNDKQPGITQDFFYDENQRLLRLHAVSYSRSDNSKNQEGFYSYEYNEDGRIASKIADSVKQYFVGPITLMNPEQTDYQYDENERLTSIHTYSAMNDFGVFKFYYDNQSNLNKEEHYSHSDDTEPNYFIEYEHYDTHPNPFYHFMQTINIPYYETGFGYSSNNILEETVFLNTNSQETISSYNYEYGSIQNLPEKIYKNGKILYELNYEVITP